MVLNKQKNKIINNKKKTSKWDKLKFIKLKEKLKKTLKCCAGAEKVN